MIAAQPSIRCSAAIPCLVDDLALWRTLWLPRLDEYSTSVGLGVGTLRQEAEATDLLPRTRRRLLRIADGFAAQLAPWVANPLLPIPITPGLIALGRTSMFTTGVLSMIDGNRSIVEVARELGAAWNVEPARLQDDLRAFLAQLPMA